MARKAPAAACRTIRRYGNRKLYDAVAGRYVTLSELAGLVAKGEDVQVLDQRSGADLTNLTLAQALLEGIRQGASRIPRQVLTRLIRVAAGPPAAWGDWPGPDDAARRARREAERLVARLIGGGRLSLDDAVTLRQDLGQLVHRLVSDAQSGVESRLRRLLSRGEDAAGRSLDALRGRIEAFGAYMEPPAPPAPAVQRRRRAQAGPRRRRPVRSEGRR